MRQSRLSAALIATALIMVTWAMPALARTEGSIPVVCTDKEEMSEILEAHGERAMMTMISHREIGGEIAEVATVLFVNPETLSWTLVERPRPGVYCAVGMGDNIRPYQR